MLRLEMRLHRVAKLKNRRCRRRHLPDMHHVRVTNIRAEKLRLHCSSGRRIVSASRQAISRILLQLAALLGSVVTIVQNLVRAPYLPELAIL